MNKRDTVFALLALGFAPLGARAQPPPPKVARIGFLISETVAGQASRVEALRSGLRERGYVEGKNIAIEMRPADGNYDRLPALAAELARLKVDVIVAFGGKAVLAARAATTTIPIVVPSSGDPVAMGLVSGLAHPGGNITGIAMYGQELSAKRMELFKEAVPRITRVALLLNSANPSKRLILEARDTVAKALKLELHPFEVRSPKEFGGAFAAMAERRIDAIVVQADSLFRAHAAEVAVLAAKQRLPSVGAMEYAEAGGLIGYGVNDAELYRRGAYFVDRILKGAKPADLPVEQPTRIEFVVNLKTAKALGLTIPNSVLLRADRVIE
jgi:putative ABC transport system substrate-binding protein